MEDRYYELEGLIHNLDILIRDLETKEDIQVFENLKFEYEREKEELEPKMHEIWEKEEWEREREFRGGAL